MKKSKILKNRIFAILLVTVLTITTAAMFCLPIAIAQKTEANAYLSFRPNPIGVNQELLVNAWVMPCPKLDFSTFEILPRFDYMLHITDPDGNLETVGPFDSYTDGSMWYAFTPNKIGNWSIKFSWPGDEFFTACETEEQTLIVQEDPIPSWPAASLPTDESLTYPINPENREWAQISGFWGGPGYDMSESNYNPYSLAPSSSHILWKLPSQQGLGGLVGGELSTTAAYLGTPSRISAVIAERGYYQSKDMIHCVDIKTGEELWAVPGTFTQLVIDQWPFYHEGEVFGFSERVPMILSLENSRFIKYDALTGELLLNETGIAGLHKIDYPYVYTVNYETQQMTKWDAFGYDFVSFYDDFSERVIWNVTVPWLFDYGDYNLCDDIIVSILPGEYGGSGALNATTGEELWYSVDSPFLFGQINPTVVNGKAFYPTYNQQYAAVNIATGETEWLSEQADYPWGSLWSYGTAAGYDLVFGTGYDGVYAFDQNTGEIIWHYKTGDSGFETSSSSWPFFEVPLVADGKLFAGTGQHTPTYPLPRGYELYCIDVFNGDQIWSIMGYFVPTAVADGTLFAINGYDCCSYAFAKGETSTTISVSSEVAEIGSSVMITGTVMDMSPAQSNTAAISDDSMSEWMEYIHMQQPCPENAEGVQVVISALDPNDNTYELCTATTSLSGSFACEISAPVPGVYKISATFEGSDSYYGSSAETFLLVEDALSTSVPIEPETPTDAQQPTDASLISTEIVVITVAVMAGIIGLAYWIVRRK